MWHQPGPRREKPAGGRFGIAPGWQWMWPQSSKGGVWGDGEDFWVFGSLRAELVPQQVRPWDVQGMLSSRNVHPHMIHARENRPASTARAILRNP